MPSDKLSKHIDMIRERLKDRDEDVVAKLDNDLVITFEEHFRFQETQAWAHAMGIISTNDAQIIYNALGESMSSKNGGWKSHVDTATKVSITMIVGELLNKKVKATA
jgi:hypothetical protein